MTKNKASENGRGQIPTKDNTVYCGSKLRSTIEIRKPTRNIIILYDFYSRSISEDQLIVEKSKKKSS